MRCWIGATLYVFMLTGCGDHEPELPVGLHGPFRTQLNFSQVIGKNGLLAGPESQVVAPDSDDLTFAFRLPPAHAGAPVALDVHAVEVDGVAAGPCDLAVTAIDRPPRWPALGVVTFDAGPSSRSGCTDAGRLHAGEYEAQIRVQGETIATRPFTVVAD